MYGTCPLPIAAEESPPCPRRRRVIILFHKMIKLNRIAIFCVAAALLATEPNEATKRWWAHVVALANDGMEGRDTGSLGYLKAERYVVAQFEQGGLKPAGENGYL